MAQTFSGPAWSMTFDDEQIEVTSQFRSPNEHWRFTDAQGHKHRYDHGYPTLDLVVDSSHWCLGDEGIAPHDPHEAVDESHYECSLCREVIEPATDPPFTPKFIRGQRSITLTGYRTDGWKLTVWITEEEAVGLTGATDEEVARFLTELPDDRVIRSQFSR